MVTTSIGVMEWGFASFSDDRDNDFNLLMNEVDPEGAIIQNSDGTKELNFGMRLEQGTPLNVWEVGHYGPSGFEKATVSRQKDGRDEKKYRPVREQDLQAPASIRYALSQLSAELRCPVWYRLNELHLSIVIEDYGDTNFEAEAFIVWLGQRLDQLILQFSTNAA